MTRGFDDITLSYLWNKSMWLWQDLRNLDLVWFGSVWENIHLKLMWKFHQDPTCFGCFREDLELVRFGLIWDNAHLKVLWKFHQDLTCFGWLREDLVLVWYGTFRVCLVWFDLRQHPSEVSVKVSSRSNIFWAI